MSKEHRAQVLRNGIIGIRVSGGLLVKEGGYGIIGQPCLRYRKSNAEESPAGKKPENCSTV
jgi:hypothetical protein